MDTYTKLGILADAAKYDVACTSSGAERGPQAGRLGMASSAGCCHSFTPDGRCITLLKVLLSNACSYDCAYCANRRSASVQRATFTPRELAELTVDFYRRNYIEGLFLSSGVLGTPDATAEHMIECLRILRQGLLFNGYVHAKVIPGTAPELVDALGRLADRLSVNLELPSRNSLETLCPDKDTAQIARPMAQIRATRADEAARLLSHGTAPAEHFQRSYDGSSPLPIRANGGALTLLPHNAAGPSRRGFAPAGQSTQLIIGATPEDDNRILQLSRSLYEKFDLKRVFFSAYLPIMDDERLPACDAPVPLRREHRLYQADWLMRYYAFSPDELATPDEPWLDLEIDPKLAWALRNIGRFPVEVMEAPLELLLRVPGVGPVGARRIIRARRAKRLDFDDLKALNITLKRARHFLVCAGKRDPASPLDPELIRKKVVEDAHASTYNSVRRRIEASQPRLF